MSAKKTAKTKAKLTVKKKAKPTAKKTAKPTAKKKTKPTSKKKTKPTQALGFAISEEAMMRMPPDELEALGLSAGKKERLRRRITEIQAHLRDMKNPFEYAKLEGVPLRRLKAFLVPNPGGLPMNDFEVVGG